ncbi:MAG: acyl carrier protein [Planctomycetota bacterium]|jgi:acyl carrier protein
MSSIEMVRKFIVDNFLFGNAKELKDDTSFMDEGIIDSTGILELVFFLEETFGIHIEDEELIPENMDSLQNITRFVARKLDRDATAEA